MVAALPGAVAGVGALPCPCGRLAPAGKGKTGKPLAYAACCQPWHLGQPAPTPEALMRSRYSAFVLGLADYLRATLAPQHPPPPRLIWKRVHTGLGWRCVRTACWLTTAQTRAARTHMRPRTLPRARSSLWPVLAWQARGNACTSAAVLCAKTVAGGMWMGTCWGKPSSDAWVACITVIPPKKQNGTLGCRFDSVCKQNLPLALLNQAQAAIKNVLRRPPQLSPSTARRAAVARCSRWAAPFL
jgi:hypothetical protein